MKKYGILAVATVLSIAAIVLAGNWMDKPEKQVSVYMAATQQVEQTVVCTGTVESANSQNVYLDMACVAGQVYTKAGQAVKKGDVLFSVDIEATKDALAAVGGGAAGGLIDQLKKEVTAPVNGVVTTLNVTEGALADASKPCAVISSSDTLQVKIAIHERDVKKVQLGQKVSVSGTAFSKELYDGEVTYISPSARQQYVGSVSETVVDAIVTLDSEQLDESLRLGLTARADVIVNNIPSALVIPYECIMQDEENREFVYVVEDGKAVKRLITTDGDMSEGCCVIEGLETGDQVVADPTVIEKEGERITTGEEGR